MYKTIANTVNCGYARVAMQEQTESDFKRFFQAPLSIGNEYFETKQGGKTRSQFETHSKAIKAMFSKKWHPQSSKVEYKNAFSITKWDALSVSDKSTHTLAKCNACYKTLYQHQCHFPAKPIYSACSTLAINMPAGMSEKAFVQHALESASNVCKENFGHNFIQSLVACKQVEMVKTKTERRKEKDAIMKKCRDACSAILMASTPSTLLKENESMASYSRKRKAQYFEKPNGIKKFKSHSPDFTNVTWDKDSVLKDLHAAIANDQKVVWSKFAAEHGVSGSNRGQILKEFASLSGVNTQLLDSTQRKDTTRSVRKRFPGSSISIPIPPTPHAIKKEWANLVSSGNIHMGEACSPYTTTKFVQRDGQVVRENVTVEGRKIPLHDIRVRMLQKQERFMHLLSDEAIDSMGLQELQNKVKTYKQNVETTVCDELKATLKTIQRTRSLALWHDHATLLGRGYIMITVHTMYDSAVFKDEPTIQSEVEVPELYLIAINPSTIEDQASIIPDRVADLHDLKEPILSTAGIPVQDVLRFFTGDHPAAQFERGTQVGGKYKCGGCGCKATIMDDQAHALRCKTRSYKELQTIALQGVLGKVPCSTKALYVPDLSVTDIRKELGARGWDCSGKRRPQLQDELQGILQGIQRVPSLILLHPEEQLVNLNLQHYTVVDCEPLHDIKGHLLNLFQELPSVLPNEIKEKCEIRINLCLKKEKKSTADLRAALIQIFLIVNTSNADWKIQMLLQSAVICCEILYASDNERCPKLLLQLYNNTWIHHQICFEIFQCTSVKSRETLFGLYLHSLSNHAAEQYELVCMRSLNTENQERLFGQSRRIAERTSNKHPSNVITSILMHLQVKKDMYSTTHGADTIVRTAAKGLPTFQGTVVPYSIAEKYKDSWQAHLERISPFLVCGKEVWWTSTDEGYKFLDGNSDPCWNPAGPTLLHFRDSNTNDVYERQYENWQYIMDNNIVLPASTIKCYNPTDGEYCKTIDTSAELGNTSIVPQML